MDFRRHERNVGFERCEAFDPETDVVHRRRHDPVPSKS